MESIYTVSQFVADCNDKLRGDFAQILIRGEVASFKVNQGKWVFFDLKDEDSNLSCFMPVWELRVPIEDGMKVVVCGTPKVTAWGKFSFTVKKVRPVGEGSIKKSFELLKRKLRAEGLFDSAKKREIPRPLVNLGVISSTGAAGYADFIKILNTRWGGMNVQVAHTQVQGIDAPDQVIQALRYFNEKAEVQMIAILRGGGSADDLAAFNDEKLVREIAASRIPIITGIGHEVDESLADLAADIRASTPSNAAEMLTPDRKVITLRTQERIQQIRGSMLERINNVSTENLNRLERLKQQMSAKIEQIQNYIQHQQKILNSLNPEQVLKRGYAIVAGELKSGNVVEITTNNKITKAEVKDVQRR